MQNDLYEDQIEIEVLVNKYNELPYLREYFRSIGASKTLEQLGIPEKFGINLLVQIALHKRCDIGTMVGLLKNYCGSAQECADLISKAVDNSLLGWESISEKLIVIFDIPEEIQHNIERFQFPLPMFVEPIRVNTNTNTGYLTEKGSILLGKAHHKEDVCLDHINRVNSIPLSLDLDVVENTKNIFKSLLKADVKDKAKKTRALNKYNKHAIVISKLLVDKGNKFYVTNKYDYRGRTYSVGYYINPQGTEYNRACIKFYDEEILNEIN